MRRISAMMAAVFILFSFMSCAQQNDDKGLGNGWEPVSSMELMFADQFSVDYYEGGYKLISIVNGDRFLVVPEGMKKPHGMSRDIVCLYQPIDNIYLVTSSAMCLFDAIDALDNVSLSGMKKDSWYIENARKAMEEGRILYAGKYSKPDYEMILDHSCPLAIENTMIGHASDVKDKLEELSIAVMVDYSSMEKHPLGRTEWIKLYASLFDKEELAQRVFDEQVDYLNEAMEGEDTGRTAVFFHISSSGYVVARKSGDYITKMMELAGGHYVFDDLGDPEKATSTVNVEMETFFSRAREADYLIYNSTIGGEIHTMEQLISKNPLLADFKAVRENNVWCTSRNMFQEATALGQMVRSFRMIFSGEADDLEEIPYLFRLR